MHDNSRTPCMQYPHTARLTFMYCREVVVQDSTCIGWHAAAARNPQRGSRCHQVSTNLGLVLFSQRRAKPVATGDYAYTVVQVLNSVA